MGSCTKASPANTISPVLSSLNCSTRLEMILLDFSRRLGITSSASIELETSSAITVSMPLRVTVSCLEPNCGRARRSVPMPNAAIRSQNLRLGLVTDTSGISCRSSEGSPKDSRRRRRIILVKICSITNSGSTASKYRYSGLANLNIFLFFKV